jgi:pilus assembly protein Flp/PilA
MITRFVKDESGVTAVEYGIIAAAIGILLIAAAPVLGQAISDAFTRIAGFVGKAGAAK